MSCQFTSEEHSDHLVAYAAGKLPAESAVNLELHLKSCAECAAMSKAQAAVWHTLDAWQPAPVSPDFDRRLYARIDAAESAPLITRILNSVRETFRPVMAQPAFAVAAATLVIATGFVLDHPPRAPRPANSHAALHVSLFGTDQVELEQVESTLDDIEMLHQFDTTADETGNSSKSM
jgi:anti-sigma factor RsiW